MLHESPSEECNMPTYSSSTSRSKKNIDALVLLSEGETSWVAAKCDVYIAGFRQVNHSMPLHIFGKQVRYERRLVRGWNHHRLQRVKIHNHTPIQCKQGSWIKHYPPTFVKHRDCLARQVHVPITFLRRERAGVQQFESIPLTSPARRQRERRWHWNGCSGRWKIEWRRTARGVVSAGECVLWRRRVRERSSSLGDSKLRHWWSFGNSYHSSLSNEMPTIFPSVVEKQ